MKSKKTKSRKLMRLFSLMLVLAVMLGIMPQEGLKARAASYNASAALSYAQANWDKNEKQLCAEYVSNCLKAGGCSAWSASASMLRRQLISSGLGQEYEITFNAGGRINVSNYSDKLAAGDPVFFFCPKETDGKPYVHVVLCNGSTGGYMKAYSHNGKNEGVKPYVYEKNCPYCAERGVYDTKITKAYIYHFNGSSAPTPAPPPAKPEVTIVNESGPYNASETSARILIKMNNWWGSGNSKMSEMGYRLWNSSNELHNLYSTKIDSNTNGGWYAYLDYQQGLLLPGERYSCQGYGIANGYDYYSDTFTFTTGHADLGSDFYATISVDGGYYLTENSSHKVYTQTKSGMNDQVWRFVRLSDGSYQIQSMKSEGRVLDVDGAGSATGTRVNTCEQWGSFNENGAQEWFIGKQGNGYALRPKCAHRALDVTGGPSAGGALQLYDANATAAQIFTITKVDKPTVESTCTLSFEMQGGSPALSSIVKKDSSDTKSITVHNTIPKRNGYVFKGWADGASKTQAYCQPGETINISMGDERTKSVKLYALWEKEATITLSFSTGTFTSIPSQVEKAEKTGSGYEALTFYIPTIRPEKAGYTFLGWNTVSNGDTARYQPGGSITISSDTTLYAVWKNNETTYTLTFDSQGGGSLPSLTATDDKALKTFAIPTDIPEREGYVFLGWSIDPGAERPSVWPGNTLSINGSTTLYAVWQKIGGSGEEDPDKPDFTNPGGDITINIYIVNFIDVSPNSYYAEAVGWAVQNQITSGTSSTAFSPNTVCTRAQAVTFLWRAAGRPEPISSDNPFSDVQQEDYYYKAVLWAVENGITSGTSSTAFSPNAMCSRAQIVTFLWRAAGMPLVSKEAPFSDIGSDTYYSDAVEWAVDSNITSGTSDNTFSPNAACARGQIVTFLYRYAG